MRRVVLAASARAGNGVSPITFGVTEMRRVIPVSGNAWNGRPRHSRVPRSPVPASLSLPTVAAVPARIVFIDPANLRGHGHGNRDLSPMNAYCRLLRLLRPTRYTPRVRPPAVGLRPRGPTLDYANLVQSIRDEAPAVVRTTAKTIGVRSAARESALTLFEATSGGLAKRGQKTSRALVDRARERKGSQSAPRHQGTRAPACAEQARWHAYEAAGTDGA
jgi:hypothetical protein